VEKRQRTRIAIDLAYEKYVEEFIERYAKTNQPKSWGQAQQTLRQHTVPLLKSRPLPQITRREIKSLLEDLAVRQPATARYTHAILRTLFRWAVDREDIEHSPMSDMKPPAPAKSRDRVLSDAELVACWRVAAADSSPFGTLIKLLIATGQRREEVAGMGWAEIDRPRAVWTIPKERAKNGKASIVPLNAKALAVIDALSEGADKQRGLVLTTTGKTPISGISKFKRRLDEAMATDLAKMAKAEGRDVEKITLVPWRLHDIRRTVATNLQQLGVRFEVTEAILNHVSGARSGVAGVYQRHDWAEEKAVALGAWSARLNGLLAPKVAPWPAALVA